MVKEHRNVTDFLRTQAKDANTKETLKAVLADLERATRAIDDFMEKNVEGRYGRKPLIDWQEFGR